MPPTPTPTTPVAASGISGAADVSRAAEASDLASEASRIGRPSFPARWQRILSHRRAPLGIAILAIALTLPSLTTGLAADDLYHRLLLRGGSDLAPPRLRPLDLFVFLDGNPDTANHRMRAGMLPWWTEPHSRIAFFRPLSSATHWIDSRLWPRSPALMHAHSLAWFALALVAAAAVYRRLQPRREDDSPGAAWPAALALFLFAVDDAHGLTIGWVANRNAVIALALALPALVFHDRRRRDGWRPGAILGPACLLLGLLAGESALATCAYLFAYAVVLDSDGPRRGLLHLFPYAAVTFAWAVAYGALGYGASLSGLYVDPLHERMAFLRAVVERLPILLASQFALPWSDVWEAWPLVAAWLPALVYVAALVTLALVYALARPVLLRSSSARFWLLGAVLGALPACATVPADRLLMFVSVGGAGLVACILTDAARRVPCPSDPSRPAGPANLLRRAGLGGLVAIHVVLAPLLLLARSQSVTTIKHTLENAERGFPQDPAIRGRTVVMANPPGDMLAGYVAITHDAFSLPRPAHMTWLATGEHAVSVERTGDRTLRVEPDGGFLPCVSEWLTRGTAHPMAVGEVVELGFVRVQVTRLTDDKRPAEAVFTFLGSVDDPSIVWLRWGKKTYEPWSPPATGQTVKLPAANLYAALLGGGPD